MFYFVVKWYIIIQNGIKIKGEIMYLDLIEIKPKFSKMKIVIGIVIAILLIVICVFLGIFFAKKNHRMKQAVILVQENQILEEKMEEEVKEQEIPVLTQKAKDYIKNIYKQQEKTVYLTFDDGPSQTVTPLILDLLKQESIKATFFVLGSRVELNPNIVKRAYDEGHYIGNHGYSHVYSSIYSSVDAIINEYNTTQQVIRNAIGIQEYNCYLFRFPGGSVGGKYKNIKTEAKLILDQNEIAYLDWNALTNDSAGAITKEAMIESLIGTIENKNTIVLLMHDAGDKILTYEVLPEIIQIFRDRGYTFGDFYNIMKTDENIKK